MESTEIAASHFPQGDDGGIGYFPPRDLDAIWHLERLRTQGATHLIFPPSAFWWFDRYPGFVRYLDTHFRVVAGLEQVGVIFTLKPWMGNERPRLGIDLPPAADPLDVSLDPSLDSFHCNVCGGLNRARAADLPQEGPSCRTCGSSVRFRSIVQTLSLELFGRSLKLPEFPERKDIVGIGLTDWRGYSDRLAAVFDYRNTFYDQEPLLDIMNVDRRVESSCDFLIATEVFEHVPPPVSVAFQNARRLLKPDGVLVFSVPFTRADVTVEHYPDLHDFRVFEENGSWILENRTRNGVLQRWENLVFHAGPGATLEMREFSLAGLMWEFARAGFASVRLQDHPYPEYGIHWNGNRAYPISARVM